MVEFKKSFRKQLINDYLKSTTIALCLISGQFFYPNLLFSQVLEDLAKLFAADTKVELVIKKGAVDKLQNVYDLKSITKIAEIELLEENLVEISFTLKEERSDLSVYLQDKKKPEDFQSFKLSTTNQVDGNNFHYQLQFSVDKSYDLLIPGLKGDNPIVSFQVHLQPVPVVKLSLPIIEELEEVIDEEPIDLEIFAEGHAPLAQISLEIRMNGKDFNQDVKEFPGIEHYDARIPYSLDLSSYMRGDYANVVIRAKAVDKSLPQALTGYSNPIELKVMSSYGQYLKVLSELKQVKEELDYSIKEDVQPESEKLSKNIAKLREKSRSTPYFDVIDRYQLNDFSVGLKKMTEDFSMEEAYSLNFKLSQFLFEHETLDDRERDQDFFVAARAFSKLIEERTAQSTEKEKLAVNNMNRFLDSRIPRWQQRMSQITDSQLKEKWSAIAEGRSFKDRLGSIQKTLQQKDLVAGKVTAQKQLTKLTQNYKDWIESLVAGEEQKRKDLDQKRQQGLASLREKLIELQSVQGKISKILDKSAQKDKDILEKDWPIARMNQNSNIKKSKQLKAELMALAPNAGGRLQAAVEAMENVAKNGGEGEYVRAESFSDLAGRLLRQTNKESQRQQNSSPRKRRRTSGDRYYGQSIHGGDLELKRDYEVDKQYREEILEDVQSEDQNNEYSEYLNDYLRSMVR